MPLDVQGQEIIDYYNCLNDRGKQVAVERVKELTEIPRYQKAPQQPSLCPSPQDSETTQEDSEPPTEGPTESNRPV